MTITGDDAQLKSERIWVPDLVFKFINDQADLLAEGEWAA